MNKAIVSVLFGNYDKLHKPPQFYGWDTILFTDNDIDTSWRKIIVKVKDPKKDSRYFKWMTHQTLPYYDLICYMDANMTLLKEPPHEQTFFRHPSRFLVRDEAKRILQLKKAEKDVIVEQIKSYWANGFKDEFGVYQNGFFVRTHDKQTNKLCEEVYNIVKEHSYRDQIAFPYALYKTGYKPANVKSGVEANRYFRLWQHTR